MLKARAYLVPLAATLLLSLPVDARADSATECNAAYEQAEVIVHATRSEKLIAGRDKLRVCSRPVCKPWMVRECTKWLEEVESRIPTVVLVARDGTGAEIADATVSLDSAPFAGSLDGRAIALDPGDHTFVFTRPDGHQASQRLIVKEGVKAQMVTVTFDPSRPETAPTNLPEAPLANRPSPVPPEDDDGVARLRLIGFVAGGAGIIGVAVGGIFGLQAIGKKSDAACVDGACEPRALSDARSAATVSTVGFVVGGLLLAGGVTLVVLAPRLAPSPRPSPRVGVTMKASWVGMEGAW